MNELVDGWMDLSACEGVDPHLKTIIIGPKPAIPPPKNQNNYHLYFPSNGDQLHVSGTCFTFRRGWFHPPLLFTELH